MTHDHGGLLGALRRWSGTDAGAVATNESIESRRSRRERRAATSTVAALAARAIALAASFVAIPLTIGYLGIERYGVLVALGSLTSMFIFADLGLGNGLLNVVSDAIGREDRATAARAVSSVFFMLVVVATALGIGALLAYPLVHWADLFGTASSTAASEIGPTAAVLLLLFLIALPLGVVERVRLAFQEGFINSLTATAGALLGLAGLLIGISAGAGLPVLVLLISMPPLLALGVNAVILFAKTRPWLRPRTKLVDRAVAARLARLGFLFLVLQLAVAVAYQSDVLVAATVIGPSAAATYSVTLKVFMLAPALIAIGLTTLWPAYTEALARGDIAWVRGTLRRTVVLAFAATLIASGMLVVAGAWLIGIWTGGEITAPTALILGAAIWAVLNGVFNAVAILLNAASVIAFQVISAAAMAVASVTLSILFANLFGVSGIIWGTVVAYAAFSAIPVLVLLPRLMERIEREASGTSLGPAPL